MADNEPTYNFEFTDAERDAIIKKVFAGEITIENLPKDLINAINKTLSEAVERGFGGIEYGAVDEELIKALQENVFMFSTAKTFSEIGEMQFNLADEAGEMLSFPDFKTKATEIFTSYQGGVIDEEIKPGWLEAEYNTANAQANNAKKWNQIEEQKSILPYLQYSTSGSACPDCAPLDGITLPVDDPFWDDYMPENHYNCNCIVIQLEEEEANHTSDSDVNEAIEGADIDDNFRFNPGKSGEVFSSKHPYFDGFYIDETNISQPKDYKRFNIQNKYNNMESVTKFCTTLFEVEAQAHIFHLQTKSFAQHSALNKLYTEVSGLRDEFIEKYQGKYGLITGYAGVSLRDIKSYNEPLQYVKGIVLEAEVYRSTLTDGFLQQICDNIIDLFYGVIYKLENLS